MCGRITLTTPSLHLIAEELRARVWAEGAPPYKPRYNVAPTQLHWIVREDAGERVLLPAGWGFQSRGGRLLINARSETAASKPSFRHAFRDRRCAVVADGFYEWTGPAKARRPLWFHPPDGGLLLLAGLWEDEGEAPPRFTVLTTDANEVVAQAHDRMPVLLPPERLDVWLREADQDLLVPAPPESLQVREVSPRVNAVANDDPDCLGPPPKRTEQLNLL
jgi:putative SOS response-associated peptidase YedK